MLLPGCKPKRPLNLMQCSRPFSTGRSRTNCDAAEQGAEDAAGQTYGLSRAPLVEHPTSGRPTRISVRFRHYGTQGGRRGRPVHYDWVLLGAQTRLAELDQERRTILRK